MTATARRFRRILAPFTLVLTLFAPSAPACTTFVLDAPDGPVFGANMDLRWGDGLVFVNRRGLEKRSYMLNSEGEPLRWSARYGSVTFNLVGVEMPWGGMNEAGLVVGAMQLLSTGYPPADARFPVSSPQWAQYVLDTCAAVDEVVAALGAIRLRGDAVHFLVADAAGDAVIVEYLGGKPVIYAGEDLPVRALANAEYAPCLGYLEHGGRPSLNPGRSAERVAAAAEWTGRYDPEGGVAATDWAMGILTEAVVDPKAWYKVLFREPYTRWSVVYDLARREIGFRTVDHAPVRTLSLANLDFDCDAPGLMMDVNAELEGPVESAMRPYDSEWNYEEARRFLDRWGLELDDSEVRMLTDILEGFECGP